MAKKDGSHEKAKGGEKKGKKNTSLRLEGKTLKALKILAIQDETSIQQIIEKLVADYLLARGVKVSGESADGSDGQG